MEYPSLKYYLPSDLNLKIKMYISQYSLIKLEADHSMRTGIECLIYSKANPCQKKFLDIVKSLLFWCRENPLKSKIQMPLKSFKTETDLLISSAISNIPYGHVFSIEALNSKLPTLSKEQLLNWIVKNPYPLLIPTHRISIQKGLSTKERTLFSYLSDVELDLK